MTKPKRITTTSPKYNRAVSANARRRGKVWAWHEGGRVFEMREFGVFERVTEK